MSKDKRATRVDVHGPPLVEWIPKLLAETADNVGVVLPWHHDRLVALAGASGVVSEHWISRWVPAQPVHGLDQVLEESPVERMECQLSHRIRSIVVIPVLQLGQRHVLDQGGHDRAEVPAARLTVGDVLPVVMAEMVQLVADQEL